MAKEGASSLDKFGVPAPLLNELYATGKCAKFEISIEQFSSILTKIASRYLPETSPRTEIITLYRSLRIEELILARACAAGHEGAWEIFLSLYREKLYDIALHIAKESSSARDLADSVYADLYGMTTREGERVCKLASYTGRGSLEGWLRTVVAQEFINRYRKNRRLISLDEESDEGMQFAAAEAETGHTVDPRLEASVSAVLNALDSEDRFILASYYLDERTLASIAQTLGVHESTISRRLDKLTKSLQKQLVAEMVRRGMARQQAKEALEVDVRDVTLNIRKQLAPNTQESALQPFSDKKTGARPSEGPA